MQSLGGNSFFNKSCQYIHSPTSLLRWCCCSCQGRGCLWLLSLCLAAPAAQFGPVHPLRQAPCPLPLACLGSPPWCDGKSPCPSENVPVPPPDPRGELHCQPLGLHGSLSVLQDGLLNPLIAANSPQCVLYQAKHISFP